MRGGIPTRIHRYRESDQPFDVFILALAERKRALITELGSAYSQLFFGLVDRRGSGRERSSILHMARVLWVEARGRLLLSRHLSVRLGS